MAGGGLKDCYFIP